MSDTRTKNSKRNMISGIIYKALTILLPFVSRTAILYILGEQYIGLSSLFTSILHVLNLAELGFSSAVVYNMYKPVAENDTESVCALMNFYKNVYHIIGTFIFIVGCSLIPFIPKLIKGSWPDDINIYILYFLYLTNTSLSYFLFAYKTAILNATQRMDILNVIQSIVQTTKNVLQILVIVIFKNYYLFVFVAIFTTILTNMITSLITDKKFPSYKCYGKISKEKQRDISKQISGLMIGKLSDISRNSFDSIVLSMMYGLTTVAIYNNYYYVYSAVYGILLVIGQAMQASIGNSIAVESKKKNLGDMRKLQFIYAWLAGLCTTEMVCLYQPFMQIWVGNRLMLPNRDMYLFCIYFYVINMNGIRNLYFAGNGMWWNAKLTFIMESVGNLILNFVLGKLLGVTGVIIATIITIVVFNFIARTNILFSSYYEESPRVFYKDHIQYLISFLLICIISIMVCGTIQINSILGLFIRGIIAFLIANSVFALIFIKTKRFKDAFITIKALSH
jgi:O-antigen/teichoic acid export membrane protein